MNKCVIVLGVLSTLCLIWPANCNESGPELDFVQMLSGVQNASQLCDYMGVDDCNKILEEVNFEDFSGDKVAVSGTEPKIALFDACNTRPQTIAIPRHPNPEIVIWPPCTRARRCGGCCTSDVFSCEPTETVDKYVKVFDTKLAYPGAQRFKFVGIRNVRIEEHVRCEAQCMTKPHECHQYQEYKYRQCRCECRPERMSLKNTCHKNQRWDDSECDCICPNRATTECPPPFRFSTTTCKCTIKTEVNGEIGLDVLVEQMVDKNLLQLNRKDEYDPDQIDLVSLFQLTGHGNTGHDGKDSYGNRIHERYTTAETPELVEVTTTETTSTTEATTTTTTTEPTTTTEKMTTTTKKPKPKCSEIMKCRGNWESRRMRNGKCMCLPPISMRFKPRRPRRYK